MCGIFGCVLNRPLQDDDFLLLRAGLSELAHRGPDGSGEWYDAEAGVYLGHRRLAILDLTDSAAQPMQRGSAVLTYNGELYNYLDIKPTLEAKGHVFRSTGDTETLLAAWEEWGPEALAKFDGMFAFALWDGRHLHLARDPFGEKFLYYAKTPDGLYFSSELAPLAKHLKLTPKLEQELLCPYWCHGFIPAPHTAYPAIRQLLPAQTAHCGRDGKLSFSTYWSAPPPRSGSPAPISKKDLDRILDVLLTSLDRRLLSDAPLCLFLSSGVDSSLVAALAKQELGRDLSCLTVSFPRGSSPDESSIARRIADYLSLPHETIESMEDPDQAGAGTVLDFYGQPHMNVTVLSMYRVSRAASRCFKVAITGMGGDEVFCGYDKHAFFYAWRQLYALPTAVRRLLASGTSVFSGIHRRLEHFPALFNVPRFLLYPALKNYPAIGFLRGVDGFDSWAREEFGTALPLHLFSPHFDLTRILPNSQLPAMDLGSMRASLELRTPFLSKDLVELMAEYPVEAMLAHGQKSVLRRLLARYLPATLREQPKMGFTFPLDEFVRRNQQGVPASPGLTRDQQREMKRRGLEGRGWTHLAIRAIILDTFLARQAQADGDLASDYI